MAAIAVQVGIVMFSVVRKLRSIGAFALCASAVFTSAADSNPLPLFFPSAPQTNAQLPQAPGQTGGDVVTDGREEAVDLPTRFKRQIVDYPVRESAGTIVIDTANTYLYVVLGNGRALRYGIGVGREGFTWSGTQTITRKSEWPDWTPPEEMLQRQPYLPRFMAGGPGNPLGARAMYLGGTIYRIHGTNQPQTIGGRVSSGCIRMVNADVIDLYNRAAIGTKVIVLPAGQRHADAPSSVGVGIKSTLY
jgi:lipoprotein-anchoring transpeptidase ErfK/SrfK